MKMTVGGGVQEASCDDRGWLPFMLRQSLIHVTASTEGGGQPTSR